MTKFNLYVTDIAPNGTRRLIVADSDHQIVDSIDGAIFGGPFHYKDAIGGMLIAVYGEYIDRVDEFTEHTASYGELIAPISVESALKRIAVSPVSDGSSVVEFIRKYFVKE